MESKKLEALLMAVDLGSFTKAAELPRLHAVGPDTHDELAGKGGRLHAA